MSRLFGAGSSMLELEAENKALRVQIEAARLSEEAAWRSCRFAQKLVHELRSTGGLTPVGDHLLNRVASEEASVIGERYKGLEDWQPAATPQVGQGDAVSIMAEDSEFSEPEVPSVTGNPRFELLTTEEWVRNHPANQGADPVVILEDDDDDIEEEQHARVAPTIWMSIDMPLDNDVLIISDSLMKTLDVGFLPSRKVEVYPFSGLRAAELLDIIKRQHERGVRAESLVLCVGTNDYYRMNPLKVIDALNDVVRIAVEMSPGVIVCTIYDSRWKGRFGSYKANKRCRQRINHAIHDMTSRSVTVLDLEFIFNGRRGMHHESRPGWYHKDSVHPNTNGIMAIEFCLEQVLAGRPDSQPRDRDLFSTPQDTWHRKEIMDAFSIKCPRKPRQAPSRHTSTNPRS